MRTVDWFDAGRRVWRGIVWDGLGWSGMVWDGLGWSGMVWDRLGWSGMDGIYHDALLLNM